MQAMMQQQTYVPPGPSGTIEAHDCPGTRKDQYSELYRREYPVVFGFVKRRCGDPSQAEDIAHEAFLTAWRRFDDCPSESGAARGWLITIARNCLLNADRGDLRRGRFLRTFAQEAVPVIPPADETVGQNQELATAWAKLSAANREVIALTAIDELSSEQAGRVLGISAAAYRNRLNRARKALRQAMPPDAA